MKEELKVLLESHHCTDLEQLTKRIMLLLDGLLKAQRKACLEEVIKTTELVGYNKQEWIAIEDAISEARTKMKEEIVNNQFDIKKYLNVKEYVKEEFDVKEEDYLKENIGYFSAKELTELIEDAIQKARVK